MEILEQTKTTEIQSIDVDRFKSNTMMTPTGSTKEFVERLALEGLKCFGVRNALSLINSWQKAGTITRKQSHDLRKKIDILSGSHESHEFNQIKK